jgi:hypothetical protein
MTSQPETTAIEEFTKDARELSDIYAEKREILTKQAISRTKWNRGLHLASGLIALLSGGAITAVLTELTSSLGVKIFAAVFAFSSGIISLVASTLFDTKETQSMFDGASQFLVLRDRLRLLVHEAWMLDANKLFEQLKGLRAEYATAAKAYDRLLDS